MRIREKKNSQRNQLRKGDKENKLSTWKSAFSLANANIWIPFPASSRTITPLFPIHFPEKLRNCFALLAMIRSDLRNVIYATAKEDLVSFEIYVCRYTF